MSLELNARYDAGYEDGKAEILERIRNWILQWKPDHTYTFDGEEMNTMFEVLFPELTASGEEKTER